MITDISFTFIPSITFLNNRGRNSSDQFPNYSPEVCELGDFNINREGWRIFPARRKKSVSKCALHIANPQEAPQPGLHALDAVASVLKIHGDDGGTNILPSLNVHGAASILSAVYIQDAHFHGVILWTATPVQ